MSKYTIEVNAELDKILSSAAHERGMSTKELIVVLLNRFAVDPHSIKAEDMRDGYIECGAMNLEWAELK